MTVLLVLGQPTILVSSDSADGAILSITCRNHPADGTRLHFERGTARMFLNILSERLTSPGKSELFPDKVMAHLIGEKGQIRLVLDAWKNPRATAGEAPPEMVFDHPTAQKLYREIAKVVGFVQTL